MTDNIEIEDIEIKLIDVGAEMRKKALHDHAEEMLNLAKAALCRSTELFDAMEQQDEMGEDDYHSIVANYNDSMLNLEQLINKIEGE